VPTAPRATERENLVETLRAADRAARSGVRVLSFAIGAAREAPVAALETARRTGGAFYPVRRTADLPAVFEAVQLDQIAELEVRNLGTGEPALYRRLAPDGSWEAIVPLAPGANRLEIRARSESGADVARVLGVSFVPDAAALPVPAGLEARRAAARAAELALVAERVDALERAAAERARARLLVEIARERAAAEHATAAQRRELALEAERGGSAPGPGVGAGPP
jgi:hypothetical protein